MILIIVSAIQFINPFLMSSTNVALPSIGQELHASAFELGLSLTILMLANGMFLLPLGRFADIHGRRRIFLAGIVVVALATLSLGLVHSMTLFLILRFIQGIGGSMILSTSIAILTSVYPQETRGRAMGIVVSMVYAGHSLGPVLAGYIISYLGWRWIFFLTFALILLAFFLALFQLQGEWDSAAGEPFDILGSILYLLSLSLIVVGASWITEVSLAPFALALGLVLLVLFGCYEWKTSYPLLNMHLLLGNLKFSCSNLSTFLNYVGISSFIFMFSLYLQYALGFSPKEAGTIIVVQPLVQAIVAPFSGRLSDRIAPTHIATMGMGLCTLGIFLAAQFTFSTSLSSIVAVLVILGVGLGFFSTANMMVIMGSVESRFLGVASSMVATMRTLGMLFSATSLAVLLSLYLGDAAITVSNVPFFMDCTRASLTFFGTLSLVGMCISFLVCVKRSHA